LFVHAGSRKSGHFWPEKFQNWQELGDIACQKYFVVLNIFCLIYIFIFVDILSAQRLYLGLSETFSLTFFSKTIQNITFVGGG